MKENTRNKIIKTAIKLFNKEGFGAVTLQELANQLSISRGNLTYHFKDKDVLLEAIVEEMWAKQEVQAQKIRQLPSFENLHTSIEINYKIQKEYAFIYLDQHVLRHPLVKNRFRKMTEQAIADNNNIIAFSIRLGNLKAESFPGLYHNIGFMTWMISFYWLNQQLIRGDKTNSFEEAEKKIWTMLIPHFTEKGIHSFIKFFGQEYYENLGKPFATAIENLVNF